MNILLTKYPTSATPAVTTSTNGLVRSSVSQTGVTTTFAYDAFQREVSQTDGRGNTARTVYDSFGRVASTIDALGYFTAYGYALRRMARFLNRKSQRHYRLKFADTYYGELNHYGMHWLRWADVRRRRY